MQSIRHLFQCCQSEKFDNVSVTYGVRRFTKIAMLIFCQLTSDQGNRDPEETMKDVEILTETFSKYRFHVETYVDLTSRAIEEKCDEFFARDFSDFGSIAVVVLAPNGGFGTLSARDEIFTEDIILKHLKFDDDAPESIYKPKLYITEVQANRIGKKTEGRELYSMPLDDSYRHVLGLHIPLVIEGAVRTPLRIFCNRMNNPHHEDYYVLIRILNGAVKEIEEEFPNLRGRIQQECTTISPFVLPEPEQ